MRAWRSGKGLNRLRQSEFYFSLSNIPHIQPCAAYPSGLELSIGRPCCSLLFYDERRNVACEVLARNVELRMRKGGAQAAEWLPWRQRCLSPPVAWMRKESR